jgi:hypothetical protein
MELTTIEIPEKLEGASTTFIREEFVRSIQDGACERDQGHGKLAGDNQRYQFCVLVDAECLNSIVHDAPAPEDGLSDWEGYVKVINARWKLDPEPDSRWAEDVDIEGCYERDVGWMRVWYGSAMVGVFETLAYNSWDMEYVRPPKVKI